MSKIHNSNNINITNLANNLINDCTIKAGDKYVNKSFSNAANPPIDKFIITQLLADVNSIVHKFNESKLLQAYAYRILRSINNKLSSLDLKSFQM